MSDIHKWLPISNLAQLSVIKPNLCLYPDLYPTHSCCSGADLEDESVVSASWFCSRNAVGQLVGIANEKLRVPASILLLSFQWNANAATQGKPTLHYRQVADGRRRPTGQFGTG